MKQYTTQTITVPAANQNEEVLPEFGRWQDVQRIFGIKRGTLYNLVKEDLIKSVCLRIKGNKHGCRLFYMASISKYLNQLMQEQKGSQF